MLLRARIGAVLILLKQRQVKIADATVCVILILPTAVDRTGSIFTVRDLILQNISAIAVDILEFIRRIYVKYKQAVGIKVIVSQ